MLGYYNTFSIEIACANEQVSCLGSVLSRPKAPTAAPVLSRPRVAHSRGARQCLRVGFPPAQRPSGALASRAWLWAAQVNELLRAMGLVIPRRNASTAPGPGARGCGWRCIRASSGHGLGFSPARRPSGASAGRAWIGARRLASENGLGSRNSVLMRVGRSERQWRGAGLAPSAHYAVRVW